MLKSEFSRKFECVPNKEGNLEWSSAVEARMYVAQNLDTVLCSLVEEGGVTRLYEGEIEDNRVTFMVVKISDHIFPEEGVDWGDDFESEWPTEGVGRPLRESAVIESASLQRVNPASSNDEDERAVASGMMQSASLAYRMDAGQEVVFSESAIAELFAPAKKIDEEERLRFVTVVGVQDPGDAVIIDFGLDEVEDIPAEEVPVVDTGRISDIVEFNQDRFNADIIPNEMTNIPLSTVLLRHDSVVLEGKMYYYSRSPERSRSKIENFIDRAKEQLSAGQIVVEPLTTILSTPKGDIRTYKYFVSEVKEIAARLRKYSPKVVGVDGEFQLVIGQYWSH